MAFKGHIPWNKNKTNVYTDEVRKRMGLGNVGKIPWNKNKIGLQIAWNKGILFSDESKKKMSESHKKNPTKYWFGKHRSGETKRKLREVSNGKHYSSSTEFKAGDPRLLGKNNPNWKGGITPINNKIRGSIEYKLWEDSVFARDGYACQRCHQVLMLYKLVGHHVLNFSSHIELRFAIDNGCTLCKKCHKKFHHLYGRKNNTKEQLNEFLFN